MISRKIIYIFILAISAKIGMADLLEDGEEEQPTPIEKAKTPQASGTGLKNEDGQLKQTPKQGTNQKAKDDSSQSNRPAEHRQENKKTERTDKQEFKDKNQNAPIKFSSEGMSGSREERKIILEEHVVVTQADMKMTADRATIIYDNKSDEIREVVATGNVDFFRRDPETGQPVTAQGQEGVYNNLARTVTLKGNPKMNRGKDEIRGRQIVYDLNTGSIKATRVEGVVQPAKQESKKTNSANSNSGTTGPVIGPQPASKTENQNSPSNNAIELKPLPLEGNE